MQSVMQWNTFWGESLSWFTERFVSREIFFINPLLRMVLRNLCITHETDYIRNNQTSRCHQKALTYIIFTPVLFIIEGGEKRRCLQGDNLSDTLFYFSH